MRLTMNSTIATHPENRQNVRVCAEYTCDHHPLWNQWQMCVCVRGVRAITSHPENSVVCVCVWVCVRSPPIPKTL